MSTENYKYIFNKLENDKIIILDGANGSELEKRGAQMDKAGWCGPASITHPKILESIHKDYIEAGAEVITTNTFSSALTLSFFISATKKSLSLINFLNGCIKLL